MTILVTGSMSKTGSRLAKLLKAADLPYLVATRRDASEFPDTSTTRMDWLNEATYANPFKDAASPITAVYLIPPETMEPASYVNNFIDLALSHGVKSFVLLAGTSTQKGSGMYVEPIWSHLETLSVQFAILRPTWFMENFTEEQHTKSIREEGVLYTAAEDGRIPFVSAQDIAESAFAFLSGKKEYMNRDYMILGPELLTHDEVASIFTDVLGRPIKHVRKSQDWMVEHYTSIGVKPLYAGFLPILETMARGGSEADFKNDLKDVIGRQGRDFHKWATEEAKKAFHLS